MTDMETADTPAMLWEDMGDPLFGALAGTVYVPPGVDLAEPADPRWAAALDVDDQVT